VQFHLPPEGEGTATPGLRSAPPHAASPAAGSVAAAAAAALAVGGESADSAAAVRGVACAPTRDRPSAIDF
jgi:hypothetical protein